MKKSHRISQPVCIETTQGARLKACSTERCQPKWRRSTENMPTAMTFAKINDKKANRIKATRSSIDQGGSLLGAGAIGGVRYGWLAAAGGLASAPVSLFPSLVVAAPAAWSASALKTVCGSVA